MKDEIIHDITKEYTDMYRVTLYKAPFNRKSLSERNIHNDVKLQNLETSLQRSTRRSVTMIKDYVRNNEFNLFVTFTFDPEKVNRYDIISTSLKMQHWLHRQKRNYKEFRYIIVPERHKDGAIHFHALIGGYDRKLRRTNVIMNNKMVYDLPFFTFGFTNAQYLDDDKEKSTAYLCKYITKDMVMLSGKKRYWASRNLIKPIVRYNFIYQADLNTYLDHSTLITETEFNSVYEFKKPKFYPDF